MDQQNYKNTILEVAKDMLARIGFDAAIRLHENPNPEGAFGVLAIESENDLSMLIGKNGQNLNAFEHIVRLLVTRKLKLDQPKDAHFIVDINDYRKSREGYLREIARGVAQRVVHSGKAEALLPMSSYERRLVHTELAAIKDIATESIGDEPRRRIVIKPLLSS